MNTHRRDSSLLGSIGISLLGAQSFFVNDFTATNETAQKSVHERERNLLPIEDLLSAMI